MNHSMAADAEFLSDHATTAVSELHQENLMNLQINELLNESQLNPKTSAAAADYANGIADIILEKTNKLRVLTTDDLGITSPVSNANVVPEFTRIVVMPNELWDKHDYRKERYFEKRNALVWKVASLLQKESKRVGVVYWRKQHADPRKLELVLVPSLENKKKKRRSFRLVLQFQMESLAWIPPLRLVPNRCNLGTGTQSVHYNHALTEDAVHTFLPEPNDNINIQQALVLLKIWCLQRGFLRGHDTFTEPNLLCSLTYLQRTNKHMTMTPWQMVVSCFKLWAAPQTVLVLPAPGKTAAQTVADCALANLYAETTRQSPLTDHDPATLLELYEQQQDTAVFLDPTMTHNYFGRLSPTFLRQVQRQAARSLKEQTNFSHVFLTPVRFWDRHDAYMKIPLRDSVVPANNSDLGEYESISRGILDVLQRALGDRVLDISCLTTGNGAVQQKGDDDSDEIPMYRLDDAKQHKTLQSPTGQDYLVLGVTVNPDTCGRVVDRGPPANDNTVDSFLQLWGKAAELRRFKDGAIVHAVVWDNSSSNNDDDYIAFQNDDTWQGGIVERIIRHILKLHFLRDDKAVPPQFALRDMVSTVDSVAAESTIMTNPLQAHRAAMKAFDELADFLRKNSAKTIPISTTEMKSALGIPLTIDAVEALSPALRYAALYPPVPHPLLGGASVGANKKKISGAVQSDPIEIQIRFGASSKWPTDLRAIGAAKTAMLIELANGIESMKAASGLNNHFDGPPILVTPSHADLCFKGYVFRVNVRSDPELKFLRNLNNPSPEAASLLQTLTRNTIVAATHHSMIHAVYTSNPSSSATVRMAKRWLSAHLLADHVPFEALELMVAHVYTNQSPLDAPGTAVAGFLRFLKLLATHDWVRQPLIVDPQRHLNEDNYSAIQVRFEQVRGESYQNGPALYIVSPCNGGRDYGAGVQSETDGGAEKPWTPCFTTLAPERVVLLRAVALADRTHAFLCKSLANFEANSWPSVFQESNESFRSFSALLRVDSAFVVNAEASSTSSEKSLLVAANKNGDLESSYTRSMQCLVEGPKALRRKLYRNLMGNKDADDLLFEWRPIQAVVQALRVELGRYALFFCNDLCPDVLAVVWRPLLFQSRAFSALNSEYIRPVMEDWNSDTLVTVNVRDILREAARITTDIVTDVKVFDYVQNAKPSLRTKRKSSDMVGESESGSSDDDRP